MSVLLNPGQSLIVEHSVGGLRGEVDIEVIRLLLPIVYNAIYGEIMKDPMYTGDNMDSYIHGHVVMKIIGNSPILLEEILSSLDLTASLAEIYGIAHDHVEEQDAVECEQCLKLRELEDLAIEAGVAISKSMPYEPALRQFMGPEGNALQVDFNDDWSVRVTCHGIPSLTPIDRCIIDDGNMHREYIGGR